MYNHTQRPSRGSCGRDRMVVDLQLPMQSVPITISNQAHGYIM